MADCTGIVGCRECDINLGCHDKIMAMIDASQRNQAAREGWGPTAQAKIATLEAKKAALEEKLAEANQWISDMQAGCYINCVYCGHRYGPDDEYEQHSWTMVRPRRCRMPSRLTSSSVPSTR